MKKCGYLLSLMVVLFLSIFFVSHGVAAYDQYHEPIRVSLGNTSAVTATVVYGSYQLCDGSGNVEKTVNAGAVVSLTAGKKLSSVNGYGRFSYGGKEYRGDLGFGGTAAINTLGMEEYLFSVVMMEIGGYSPDVEALKAQAVACRNFACRRLKSPRTSTYDILSTTSDQAYGGYSAERYDTAVGARVREAVNGTRDLVMYYKGELIGAYYMSNAGGHTENVENVWGSKLDYLRGMPCPWDSMSFEGDAGTYVSVKLPTTSEWSAKISFVDLSAKIGSVGTVTDVAVSHEGCVSGYVSKVTVKGTAGTKTYTGSQFRSLLGLRSSNFDIIVGGTVAAMKPLSLTYVSGANFDSSFRVTDKVLVIQGRGYGHSVGMSQWSACVMAYMGYSYREILNYFYNQNQNDNDLTFETYH